MSGGFLAGVVAGYGIAVPVGAIAVLIAGLSARTSLRVGAAAGMGAATADGVYALVAVAGGAAAAGAIAQVETLLRWAGAAALLILAGWTAWGAIRRPRITRCDERSGITRCEERSGITRCDERSGINRREERPATVLRAYTGVLALTLLNPATVIYFAALVLAGADGGAWFVAGAFLASASWQLLIAGGGSLIGRVLVGDRGRFITALISSVVISVLAVRLILGV